MPLQPFATKEQMDQRSRGAITVSSHPFLETELKAATDLIRRRCGWHIATVEELHYRKAWASSDSVLLPAMQISGISAVTINGTEWEPDALSTVEFDPDTGITNLYGRTVDITYTAGYAEVPVELVTLTLQIAARALGSPLGAVREQTLVSSVLWSATAPGVAGGAVILPHEEDTLAPFILGRVA